MQTRSLFIGRALVYFSGKIQELRNIELSSPAFLPTHACANLLLASLTCKPLFRIDSTFEPLIRIDSTTFFKTSLDYGLKREKTTSFHFPL